MKKLGRPKFQGCNEDCFHCPYADCEKPAYLMPPTKLRLFKVEGESQARMFTLELGGYGGENPNISKKFLRSTLW